MSSQSGFDYDLLISRLHGGVRAFQSLRAHRRQRDQPPSPPPDERPTPPPSRASQPHPDEPVEARAVSSLEPQAFIAVNGRVVPLFGDLGAGMFGPASPAATMPPASSDTPPVPPRPVPSPASEEPKPPPTATAPAPAPSPLKLPLPTPPARLGLIYGGHPRPPAAEPQPPASPAAAQSPTIDGPSTSHDPAKAQDIPSTAAIAALLDARAHEEALRLEKIHAEHRACITQLLQEHRNELRAQSEADAARTAQLLRDLLAEHRAELAQAAQTNADHLAQILAQHQHHVPTQHEPATPPDDALRSALIEHAKLQREANEGIADHIGALTTIVADLGQTVGMLAVAAVQASSQPVPSPSTQVAGAAAPLKAPPPTTTPSLSETPPRAPVPADSPPFGPPATSDRARESPGAPQPARAPTVTTTPPMPDRDRDRVLQCLDDDRDDDLAITGEDDAPPPRSRLRPITPLSATKEPGDD